MKEEKKQFGQRMSVLALDAIMLDENEMILLKGGTSLGKDNSYNNGCDCGCNDNGCNNSGCGCTPENPKPTLPWCLEA